MLVFLDGDRALLLLHLDRDDLLREPARLARLRREHVAAVRELIGLLTCDPVLVAKVLRGVPHAEPVVRVDQRDPEVVLELLLAERQAPASAADLVRSHAHGLGAAGQDEVRLAQLDLLRAEQDRLQAGAAEAIDRERGRFLRHA